MDRNRDRIASLVSTLLNGRPTRWTPPERLVGDYDGRENSLEVFDALAGEQRYLLRRLRPFRREIEQEIGGPLIVIFHTPSETARLYPDVEKLRLCNRDGVSGDFLEVLLLQRSDVLDEPSPVEHTPDPVVPTPPYVEAA
jgi:hypothetical protein